MILRAESLELSREWVMVGGRQLLFCLAEAPSPGILYIGNDLSLYSTKGLLKALIPTAALGRRSQPTTDFSRNLGSPAHCSELAVLKDTVHKHSLILTPLLISCLPPWVGAPNGPRVSWGHKPQS